MIRFFIVILLSLFCFFVEANAQDQPVSVAADSTRIIQLIDEAYTLYDDYEIDSSLFRAQQALQLSMENIAQAEDISYREDLKLYAAESAVLVSYILMENDLEAAEETLRSLLALLDESDALELGLLNAGLAMLYEQKSKPEMALEFSKKALEFFEISGDSTSYMDQLNRTGITLRETGKYAESLEYFIRALNIGRELQDSTAITESLLAMGFVYTFVEKWEDALKSQREALGIYRAQDDSSGIARIYNDMGVTYDFSGQTDSALINHKKALEIRKRLPDTYDLFSSYTYVGDMLGLLGDQEGAIASYDKALSLSDDIPYKIALMQAHLSQGDNFFVLDDIENATFHYKKTMELAKEVNDPTGISQAGVSLALVALLNGNDEQALELIREAERYTPDAIIHIRENLYREIANTYFEMGDFKNAYLSSLLYAEVKDSVQAAENISSITQLTNKLAFESEMALQKESNEKAIALKQAEIDRGKFTRNIFLFGMIFAIVLVGITLVRFIEKKKLNTKLSDTLDDLKATQKQLIQSEKMASLGELTAGIAHEIQNPLNFVNNFAEVSEELVEEAEEELNDQNLDDVRDLLGNVKFNLSKINHHGKRADSIIKGMLLHSRGGDGKKEPVEINAFIKESVNLSYHGMRAGKNPIDVDIHFELDEELAEKPLVREDFSRVIVNMCNNAFDAMREKTIQHSKSNIQNYSPRLTVRTVAENGKVSVEIEDNGPGIPEEIKDKILQPFFTTKKGTEGTGLGLSITNDIVKAHGGSLDIRSTDGSTIFTINLAK